MDDFSDEEPSVSDSRTQRTNSGLINSVPVPSPGRSPSSVKRINLRQAFPVSPLLILAESFPYVVILLLTVAVYLYFGLSGALDSGDGGLKFGALGLKSLLDYLYYFTLVVCAGKVIYECLCFLFLFYSIEVEHLTICRGLLFRSRSSFPIAKINDISLHRTPLQILLGLHTLDILTASPTTASGSIEGLHSRAARGLQAYLLALLESTLPDVSQPDGDKILRESATGKEENESLRTNQAVTS